MKLFDYWGKSRRGEHGGGDDYHLLCWHSLDVAAVGYRMVQQNIYGIAGYLKKMGVSDNVQASQFFAWLLCWHDIGKFAHSFQQLYNHSDLTSSLQPLKKYEKFRTQLWVFGYGITT